MLQLHRPLHCSATMQLGHLTTGLSLPSMPSKERCSMQMLFSTVFLHMVVSVTASLSPPTDPHPVIGRLPCVEAVLSPLPLACLPDLRGVPRRYLSLLFVL